MYNEAMLETIKEVEKTRVKRLSYRRGICKTNS